MKEFVISEAKAETAVLVGLITQQQDEAKTKEYLDELEFLADTAGAVTVKRFTQKVQGPSQVTYVGKGKLDEIKQYINNMGYFISNSYIDTVLSEYGQVIHIQVEPKFIIEATDEIYKLNYLYHITLGVKYDKIKNKGLIPKSYCKKVYHPDRIYFYYKELDDFNFINQAKSLYKNDNEYIDNVKKFINDKGLEIVILKIDLSKYNKLQYRFFYDPNQMLSVFTYEVIHPDCVSFYKSFYI